MDKICGIYKVTNPKKRIYIGQSVDCHKRFKAYKSLGSNTKVQRRLFNSLVKHGNGSHVFEIIHVCHPSQLNEMEKYYIDLFQTFNSKNGLNLRDGGGSRGRHSEETRIKMSIARKGIVYSEETKRRMSEGSKGCTHSEETKKKMSASRQNISKETREKCRLNSASFWLGKKLSPETCAKLRVSHTGKKQSVETIQKRAKSLTGLKRSDEQKRRMSEAQKKRLVKN